MCSVKRKWVTAWDGGPGTTIDKEVTEHTEFYITPHAPERLTLSEQKRGKVGNSQVKMLPPAHIGTSGWSYDHWQGVLYPEPTPVRQRLDYYTARFTTVELNSSFYHWPRTATFTSWEQRLPPGFLLTVKAPRVLSHSKRLYSPEEWLVRIEGDMALLKEKRGPLLVQTPPNLAIDLPRLEWFLDHLAPERWCVFEFRHPSWHQESTFALLEKRPGTAYCIMSGANLPCILRATASFVYVRLHGPDPNYLYGGSYSDDDLRWWAERLHEWQQQGRTVFAYFNNDGYGNAVRNALTLLEMLQGIAPR